MTSMGQTTAATESDRSSTRTAADQQLQQQQSKDLELATMKRQTSDREKVDTGKEVVVDPQSGKVELKSSEQGPYTLPRWRHSLPFVKRKYPPPPPKESLDDAELIPDLKANYFSLLVFNWISPIMALGAARTLQPTDLWRMDDARGAAHLSNALLDNFERRKVEAEDYNIKLALPSTPLPWTKRMTYPLMPHRAQREHKFRTGFGRQKPSLAWALSDTFGLWFWLGGLYKIASDTLSVTSPLVVQAIIRFAQDYRAARNGTRDYPNIGHGIGMAFGLFFMLVGSSLGVHQFFYRGAGTGVLARGALISAIYQRGLQLSGKARGEIPNGRLVNHISTDTSRIDFAAGFFHIAWTAPIQFAIVVIILCTQIGYSALPGIAFLALFSPIQTRVMKSLFAFRKKSMAWTDKRAKLLQELLGGMRVVKLMSWEVPFLDRLGDIRRNELRYIRSLLNYRSGMMAVALSLPTIAAVLSFVTYSLVGNELEPAKTFAVLTLYQLVRLPLMMWPMTISACVDAHNALGRLSEVFLAELNTEARVVDENMDDAVRIESASFTWDAAPPVEADPKSKGAKGGPKGPSGPGGASKAKAAKKPGKLTRWIKNRKTGKIQVAEEVQAEITAGKPGAMEAAMPGNGVPPASSAVEPVTETEPAEERIFSIQDIDLAIPRGALVAVVGAIGSGKSSLLSGLVGEMRRTSGKVTFGGSTALCAQTAWIMNATLRENILFGLPFNEERYWSIIRDACLEPDLELLEDGDATEIGEKGINLSGGQKQRVNIARAMYFDADIIALDDPLSALDAGVGRAIFFNAIVNGLAGKTRILVTHALHFLPHVDLIITMENGRIAERGAYSELKNGDGPFSRLIAEFGAEDEHEAEDEKEEMAIENAKGQGGATPDRSKLTGAGVGQALIQAEERNAGSVKLKTILSYIKAGRGSVMLPLLFLALVIGQAFTVMTSVWLTYWIEKKWGYGQGFYMGIYAALGIGSAIGLYAMGFTQALITYLASVELHRKAITRIMLAPQSFFDTTPLGRIMNRMTKDVDVLDNTLGDALRMALSTLAQISGAIILIAIVAPYFLAAMFVIAVLYAHAANFYRASAREFKRIDAVLRSSLYSHFSESLSGIGTIRAYAVSERFIADNAARMDVENRAYFLTIVNQRWLGVRLDALGSCLTLAVALIVVLAHNISPASGGLILSYILTVQQSFSWLIRQLAEVENDMVSVERIMFYADELEQEAPHQIENTKPPANWPLQGRIEFKDLVMSYRAGLPAVLKGLSFEVAAGEKVGVVGRTGAGKSSILVALFRLVEVTSGRINVDGLDLSTLGLSVVRKAMSIIPQDAVLYQGTIRSNLDPFGHLDDAQLNDALKRAHLVNDTSARLSLDAEGMLADAGVITPKSRVSLDTVVEAEGANFSVGERSLISLARALAKDSQIVVLDEATSSVDLETDAKIQETIRKEFKNKTILCIAHRLRTILAFDKILVMHEGRVAEFDTPLNLFQLGGIFTSMCDNSSISAEDLKNAAAQNLREHSLDQGTAL